MEMYDPDGRLPQKIDFFHSRRSAAALLPLIPDDLQPANSDEGYSVLMGVHRKMISAGARRAGYKIGCTTPRSQAAMGANGPVWAGLFQHNRADTILAGLARTTAPRAIECEIAVTLSRDLDADPATLSDRDLQARIASCAVACEIVENRYGDLADVATLLADDFLQSGFVVAPPAPDWRALDFTSLRAETRINGRTVGTGISSSVMGSPYNALRWLACDLLKRGSMLRAGDLVFTGSVVPPVWLDHEPASVEVSIEGLGSLR